MTKQLQDFKDDAAVLDVVTMCGLNRRTGPLLLPMAACLWHGANEAMPEVARKFSYPKARVLFENLCKETVEDGIPPTPLTALEHMNQDDELAQRSAALHNRPGRPALPRPKASPDAAEGSANRDRPALPRPTAACHRRLVIGRVGKDRWSRQGLPLYSEDW